jgi:folate-binding protein YgfZ
MQSTTLVMDPSKSFYQFAPAAHLLVTDEDAADFLQSQFTNELRPFDLGQATYGLWLDVKGKVIADSVVICEGAEQFRVISECCVGELIATHMERHIIADDVEIEHGQSTYGFELPARAVEALGLAYPESGRFLLIEGGILYSVQDSTYNMLIYTESVAKLVSEKLTDLGFIEFSASERGLARIDRGRPLVPDEIGAADMPGEGGLERDAISFTKGCYLGQEVVARMYNVGKAQRGLFVVSGEGVIPELPLALKNSDSKQVGELRTAYMDGETWQGVAILKTRFAGVGETLRYDTREVSVLRALREGFTND